MYIIARRALNGRVSRRAHDRGTRAFSLTARRAQTTCRPCRRRTLRPRRRVVEQRVHSTPVRSGPVCVGWPAIETSSLCARVRIYIASIKNKPCVILNIKHGLLFKKNRQFFDYSRLILISFRFRIRSVSSFIYYPLVETRLPPTIVTTAYHR